MKKPRKKIIHPYILSVGAEIKRIRLQRKLSLDRLGSEIGLDASNVRKLEMGQNLTLSTLLKLCICLDIAPVKIFEKINWDLTEKDLDSLTKPQTIKRKVSNKKR
jgi:DNA-binding Xre family transcriptional regulator